MADEAFIDTLKRVETKWQDRWAEEQLFEVDPNADDKFFITVAYPYVTVRSVRCMGVTLTAGASSAAASSKYAPRPPQIGRASCRERVYCEV